ncbi:hypothetical protein CTRI78_v003801 [Colletotrichum trifolii]|uniref:Uncharacterized protein n=1 Tax=Colletotrichum trifolii TaxID=5466 RepID=A0A4R8RJ90_COLTR|nr:hypothetical protein CTRI78_v003801 [Colletotrichum trifolii]
MDPSSPAKRRALAPLDANVNAMSPAPKRHNKTPLPNSPIKTSIKSPPGLKRPIAAVVFDENSVVAKKKQCQEPVAAPLPRLVHVPAPVNAPASTPTSAPASAPAPAQRTLEPVQPEEEVDAKEGQTEPQPEKELVESPAVVQSEGKEQHLTRSRAASPSPDVSSVFDSSAMDTSQNTTLLTEPDTEQTRTLPPPRQKRLLTREEARQKARILRLKLGLANYKLRTGQEDVPLDMLQMKPLPGHETKMRALPTVTVQPPSSRDGPSEKQTEESKEPEDTRQDAATQDPEKGHESTEKAAQETETGCDDDSTHSSCGRVASSLLSLARASSAVSASS